MQLTAILRFCSYKNGLTRKIYRVMKLTAFLLTFAFLQVTARTSGQTVSLNVKNAPFKNVLLEIQKQTGLNILIDEVLLEKVGKVTLNRPDMTVQQVLDICFKNKPVTYTIADGRIAMKPISTLAIQSPVSASEFLPPPPITGTITDDKGKPLAGASILVKGSGKGTKTDSNGSFSIDAPPNSTLTISYVGFENTTIKISSQTTISVQLKPSFSKAEEVVVIGYGATRKRDLTGSVSQVKTEQLESFPVYNIGEALKGRSSGVQVTNNSNSPGSRIEVRIRGGNSMIGSNTPLYVVDGFPLVGGIDFLNPSDIESMDILKDASATAIYGSRGANGVVIITSKRGKAGQQGLISINSYYSQQEVAKRFKMLNPKQYAVVANEWMKNGGLAPYFNVDTVNNVGTDWQDVIFSVTPTQSHTITFSGTSDKTRYSLSGNYFGQEGIIFNSGIKRGSFRLNLDHDIKSWLTLGVNLNVSRRERMSVPVDNGDRGNTVFSGAISAPPTLKPYDVNGLLNRIEQYYPFVDPTDLRNPLIRFEPWKDRTFTNSVLQNTTLQAKIVKGLTFKTLVGLETETASQETFVPIIFANDRGSASQRQSYYNSFVNENTLTYKKSFSNSQNLDLVGGFTYQTNGNSYTGISVSGFPNNITQNYNLGSATTINPPSSGISKWSLVSWLGRANYSIRSKYFLTVSARADGSSRFGNDNKWGVFPSGAVAWRVSDESFMNSLKFINNLKFRASYGITGNTALSPYQSLNRLSSVRYIDAGQAENIGYAPSGISNSKLKWETTSQLDIGFDLGIINNQLGFTFDYYKKNTNNLLASVPLPPSVGFGNIIQNIGEIQNEGIEVSVNADILTKGFKWDISAQVSSNKNKVVKLSGNKDIVSAGAGAMSGYNIARTGQSLGMFFGYIEDGLDVNGLIKYKDINGDGVINPLDRVILGNPNPDYIFGFNSNFQYKNFDLNIFLEGVYGNKIFFQTMYTNLNSFQRGQNQMADLYGNYWTKENPNPNSKYPKISSGTQMQASNRFIKDGSYMRVKTLQLGYNIPIKNIGGSFISKARVYIKANNLFTLTNYMGLDPDVNTTGNDSQDIGTRLETGIDRTAYPNAKIYSLGIQLNF